MIAKWEKGRSDWQTEVERRALQIDTLQSALQCQEDVLKHMKAVIPSAKCAISSAFAA